MIPVDVLIVGGGLQGLVLLRELTAARYTCLLVSSGELGAGQTLHSHGLLNSGTGLLTGALHEELHEHTLPYLRALGVPVHGEDRSFLLVPAPVAAELAPAWEANAYRPEPVEASSLPPGLVATGAPYRVPGFNVDKRRLVQALAAGVQHLVVRGEAVCAGELVRVRHPTSGHELEIRARAVVVAAGCGTKRVLRDVFGLVGSPQLARLTFTKPHMICLRAPAGALPDIGTVLTPEVMVVGHRERDEVLWYVTPRGGTPERHAEAPDSAMGEVDAAVVTAGVEALLRLVPSLARTDGAQATVFAGYKQDLDESPIRRGCELVDGDRNILLAAPSVLANAVPNARDALAILLAHVEPSGRPLEITGGGASVGELPERGGPLQWSSWDEFTRRHGVRTV